MIIRAKKWFEQLCSLFLFNTENTEGTELFKPFFCTNYHVIDHE